ncbi:hypothetical protein BD289DRAFT_370657 [Coniella lustricola]|uniref:Uncharacterized protein n=1 Tax=Coniella lustricola TaxID=2025994 RepID=A0A2T3A4V4_9PEZI|nr:hypothetical protein BD289DRAFT_370657 [Coniella lustricola]
MREVEQDRFKTLVSWATAHGGSLHPSLEVYKDSCTGFSIRVKLDRSPTSSDRQIPSSNSPIQAGDEVLSCPLNISLSYLNALSGQPLSVNSAKDSASNKSWFVFPPAFHDLPPHVIGRFFLMKEYLAGSSSFWHPYIATLPQPDVLPSWSLPPFWSEDDTMFLEGTNTGISAAQIRDQLQTEFKEARRILKDANWPNWQDYTRTIHNWAFSMFASRSFRPSLVIPKSLRDSYSLAEQLQMGQQHETADGGRSARKVAIDDFSILLPVFDIINHSPRAQVRWSVDDADHNAKTCHFHTFDTYQPGDQIFNSYGKKTNSELFLSYGFTLPETENLHNDYVHVRTKAGAGAGPMVQGAGPARPAGPAQDFVVSLRPINNPSSLVGSARQLVARDASFDLRPEFAHVQDSLVWDLCLAVVGPENKLSFISKILSESRSDGPSEDSRQHELECLRQILSASVTLPIEVIQVLDQVKQVLLAKLGMEYDKICETDPGAGVDDEGNEVVVEVEPQTRNQEIAIEYRAQLKNVLENAITTLVPDWQSEAMQE